MAFLVVNPLEPAYTWFLRSREFRESQGILKYLGAKVNKDAEKILNCVHRFKTFSARFARRLFARPVLHLFHRCRS